MATTHELARHAQWIEVKKFRQANRCADRLARMAVDRNLDFISFESPR